MTLSSVRMDPDVKRRWLEALRSGAYEQTVGYLSRDGGYCCLGVLCEVAVKDGVIHRYRDSDAAMYASKIDYTDASKKTLPDAAVLWAGLRSENPTFKVSVDDLPEEVLERVRTTNGHSGIERNGVYHYNVALAELNDVYGLSFNQIADLVEKYL